MKIAAAYVRVSDERQDEYSPDSQIKLIRDYAKRRDYMIPEEYVYYDDGISASSTKHRSSFNRMISDAESTAHPFDAIIVWKYSRFARNTEDSILYKARLRRCGVSVLSVSENIDEGSEYGGLIERIIEWDDAHYLTRLSQEVKRGMLEKASRGEPMSRQFGYDLRNKQLIPNADAETVRYIFSAYNSGTGIATIARNLNASGFRTSRGNPADNRFVEYVLRNPVYIGKIRWSKDGRSASKRDYNSDNIVLFDGKHDPLIDLETWDKTQQLLDETKKRYAKYQRTDQTVDLMLKGLLRCDTCGATLITVNKSVNPYWQCHKYAKGSCHVSHGIINGKAEQAVIDALNHAVNTMDFTFAPAEQPKHTPKVDYDKLIRAELSKLQKAKDAYLAEIDTIEEYRQNKTRIQSQIDKLTAERDQTAEKPIDRTAFAEKVAAVTQFIQSDASPKAKNETLRTVIRKIVFDKSENKLYLFFYK